MGSTRGGYTSEKGSANVNLYSVAQLTSRFWISGSSDEMLHTGSDVRPKAERERCLRCGSRVGLIPLSFDESVHRPRDGVIRGATPAEKTDVT